MSELDTEVERILAMSDEEVLATATPEEMGWARGFKEGLSVGMRARGWQPIETAPKDGIVLLYWPAIVDLPEHIAVCDHRGGPFRHPTHWMPLPEPPKP